MTKPMTAAEYRAHAAAQREQQPTVFHTCKSGSRWELRPLDLQGHVLTGSVPQSLLEEGVKAWRANGVAPVPQPSTSRDVTAEALIFMREVVHEITVRPKFVEFATNDNEISARDMLKEDFLELYQWALQGQAGAGLDGLRSFREGRERRTSTTGTNRKKQRRARKLDPEVVGSVQ